MAFFLQTLSPEYITDADRRDKTVITENQDTDRAEALIKRSHLIWSIFKEVE